MPMMKSLLAGVIFFLACHAVQAQEPDSLSTERLIMNYKPQKTELITKARAMLTDIFPDSDRAKVLQLIHYMDSAYQDQGYTVFSSDENILLGYWTGDYQQLLGEIKPHLEYDMGRRYYRGYQAQYYDNLDEVIAVATSHHKDSLVGNIMASALRADEKDFLAIYLGYILLKNESPHSVSDSLREETDMFLQNHPHSPYAEFVKKELRNHGRALPNFGFGMAFSPAGGIFLTKELSNNFKNAYSLDLEFDFYFNRIAGFFRLGGGFGKTKVDIPVTSDSLMWKKGSRSGPLLIDGSIGYVLLDKRKTTLTPFAGISYTEFAPSAKAQDNHEELEDFKRSAHAYHCGINLDYVLGAADQGYVKSYGFIRFRYTCYFPQLEKRYGSYSGMMHNVAVAIGGLIRPDKKGNRSPVPFDNYRYQ